MIKTCKNPICGHDWEVHNDDDGGCASCPCEKFEAEAEKAQLRYSKGVAQKGCGWTGKRYEETGERCTKYNLCPSCSGNHTRHMRVNEGFAFIPDEDFDLSVIMKKPIKELNNREKYLRYKKTFDENSKKQSKKLGKEYFADASRKYAHSNKDKINEKARRVYNKDKTKALVRAKTRHYHKKKGLCQKCGLKGKTDFHHPPPMSPDVFVEVCNKCHNEIHGRELYVKQ
ncbi:hypothetical protein LCGC14_0862600 [marine sediment metagenome]|uniref:Uncharacterized protein n=1 Tax=marine sediment metagenome TaxID=412755 RepID=A0A0F9SE03_9ZZZZ